jgi:hypothetical protein
MGPGNDNPSRGARYGYNRPHPIRADSAPEFGTARRHREAKAARLESISPIATYSHAFPAPFLQQCHKHLQPPLTRAAFSLERP